MLGLASLAGLAGGGGGGGGGLAGGMATSSADSDASGPGSLTIQGLNFSPGKKSTNDVIIMAAGALALVAVVSVVARGKK